MASNDPDLLTDAQIARRMRLEIAQYVAKSEELRDRVRKEAAMRLPLPGIQLVRGVVGVPQGQALDMLASSKALKTKLKPPVSRTLRETVFYPEHEKRTSTAAYKNTRKTLINDEKRGCLICGVKIDVLEDPVKQADPDLNPYGAKTLETHHHVVEWAFSNAIDVDKFNKLVLPNLRARHKDNELYKKELTPEEVRAWIDSNRDNLWVLCDVHHRAKYVGVHEITFPIWGPQDIFTSEATKKLIEMHKQDIAARSKRKGKKPSKRSSRPVAVARRKKTRKAKKGRRG